MFSHPSDSSLSNQPSSNGGVQKPSPFKFPGKTDYRPVRSENLSAEPPVSSDMESQPQPAAPAQAPLGKPGPHSDSKPGNPFGTKAKSRVDEKTKPLGYRAERAARESEDEFIEAPKPQPKVKVTENVHGGTPQLILRALFGVTKELNEEEILKHAGKLAGVERVAVIERDVSAAFFEFTNALASNGFGTSVGLSLQSADGQVDLIDESGLTLVVARKENYRPGVRESLIIVARELACLR